MNGQNFMGQKFTKTLNTFFQNRIFSNLQSNSIVELQWNPNFTFFIGAMKKKYEMENPGKGKLLKICNLKDI